VEKAEDALQREAKDAQELVEDQHHSLQEIKREHMLKQGFLQSQGHGASIQQHPFLNAAFSARYILPNTEYTTVCNTDFAPLICNEFVSSFLQQDNQGMGNSGGTGGNQKLERREAIDLTRHLCHWLAKEGMSCAVVELNA